MPRRGEEYVRRGPPHIALRVLVAPLVVVSTVFVFGTGVALLAVDQTHGTLVGLHKASFIVWFGATAIHCWRMWSSCRAQQGCWCLVL
jgi:hypothetical protein